MISISCPLTLISIHAPRVGSDSRASILFMLSGSFLSTLPAWGATDVHYPVFVLDHNFYPRSPRGERLHLAACLACPVFISIHAPRVGSDFTSLVIIFVSSRISIHAPRVGSDRTAITAMPPASSFLSTLPAWGATVPDVIGRDADEHFYPRSPRGERPAQPGQRKEQK